MCVCSCITHKSIIYNNFWVQSVFPPRREYLEGDLEHATWEQLLRRNVKRCPGGLVFKAHRLLYHSTLGLRVMKKETTLSMKAFRSFSSAGPAVCFIGKAFNSAYSYTTHTCSCLAHKSIIYWFPSTKTCCIQEGTGRYLVGDLEHERLEVVELSRVGRVPDGVGLELLR